MNIEKVKIGKLVMNPNNPRTIKDDKFKKLVKSIKDFPEMLDVRPIVVDEDMIVLGGNMRLKACISAGLEEVSIIRFENLPEEKKKEFIVKDNVGYGEWDFELLLEDWTKEELIDWGMDMPKNGHQFDEEIKTKLADRFIVPPFTVLDTRQGDWQERKKIWSEYLKEFGESRENTLSTSGGNNKSIYSNMNGGTGVSLFNPVIAEVMFHWFTPEKSNIIDPFAGDIRKGAVAGFLKHNFTGIEIRPEQFEINNHQIDRLKLNDNVRYVCDSGTNILKHVEEKSQDLLFSCPPYYDLEQYSKMEDDASNQETYEDFIKILDEAFTNGIKALKDNRFAVVVVGDLREKSGYYYNFHEDIKFIFNKAGMPLYNELILVEPIGIAAMRANKAMATRKTPKTHQNILVFYKPETKELPKIESIYRKIFVFYKGDPSQIKNDFKQFSYNNIDIPTDDIDNDLNNMFDDGDDE
jgi:DNA modification methylase